MSSKVYKDEPCAGMFSTHCAYGEVELIGRVEHDGDSGCVVWLVKWTENEDELKLVDENDLSDFYYWGD